MSLSVFRFALIHTAVLSVVISYERNGGKQSFRGM